MKDALGHGSNAHNSGIAALPPKGAAELKLFGDNDGNLYRQSQKPVEDNLDKKIAKGVYDHGLATKLWGYHADRAAQSYNRQMPDRPGQKWHEQFPPNVRQASARQWADEFKADRQSSISARLQGSGPGFGPQPKSQSGGPGFQGAARAFADKTATMRAKKK